jgi:predicted Zn-dependent protease with MMP-like domain
MREVREPARRDPPITASGVRARRFVGKGALSRTISQVTTARRTLRRSPRRRDRRGRGLRGLLYPATTPAARTRAEKFDAMVLEALEPIELRWGSELADLDLAVDEVPEVDKTSPDDVVWGQGVLADIGVPLAQLVPAGVDPDGMPSRARIVIYRRPLEARARGGADLADLLHEVLVEQVAEYLNIEPDAVDGGEH